LQRWSYQRLPEAKSARLILLYEIGKYGPEYRHIEGMYIGFGDGHVKWYPREAMTPGTILGGVVPAAKP
ncbi:MAG: H-X9-DG-CTERM domain-containing protein, partial [Armatimonadota bacterium]